MAGEFTSRRQSDKTSLAVLRFIRCLDEWLLVLGGTLAIAVSLGLFFSLIIRPTASLNPLNMTTLVLASVAGIGTILYSNRPRWLLTANALLLLAVIPTAFGWIWLLYVTPVTFVMIGTGLKVFWKLH